MNASQEYNATIKARIISFIVVLLTYLLSRCHKKYPTTTRAIIIISECLGSYCIVCPNPPSIGEGCPCAPPPTRLLFPKYALAGKPVVGKLDVPPL
jgi:hypothetical protein